MSPLFVVPLWVDLLAVGLASLQAATLAAQAKGRGIDLLGVTIVGIAAGLGGGILRDVLIGVPPATFTSNAYILVAAVAALCGMLLERAVARTAVVITLLDALSIGMFCAIGVSKAIAAGVPFVPAITIGVVAAVGGGMLRDLLLDTPIAVMHVGSLYAVAALAGAIAYVGLELAGAPVAVAAGACVAITTLVRLLSVRLGWSLPEQYSLRLRRR